MAKPPTLLEVAVRREGPLRGARVLSFMVAWDVVRQELDHAPTIEEYAEWWKLSIRTAYREQASFRKCFPTESDPTRLMDAARASWDERKGVRGLGSVALPV